jgi:Phage protein Gp138 N-terminal domain
MSDQPVIPLNLPRANPGLKDVLDLLKQDVLLSMNCHAIGTVQSVSINDNGLVVANATVNYTRTYYTVQPNGSYIAQQQAYPQMVDCPVIVLGGGSASISFPIEQGDLCLVLFNDRDLNNWFASPNGAAGPVASARLHSFADAIILVGFQQIASMPDTGKVLIQNDAATLGSLMGSLIDTIKNITTTTAGTPGTISPASQANLTSVASQIGSLLE